LFDKFYTLNIFLHFLRSMINQNKAQFSSIQSVVVLNQIQSTYWQICWSFREKENSVFFLNRLIVKWRHIASFENNNHMIETMKSISPRFYDQLLHTQIPKAQIDTDDLTVFLHFKNLCTSCAQNVGEINTKSQFHQCSMSTFSARRFFFHVPLVAS